MIEKWICVSINWMRRKQPLMIHLSRLWLVGWERVGDPDPWSVIGWQHHTWEDTALWLAERLRCVIIWSITGRWDTYRWSYRNELYYRTIVDSSYMNYSGDGMTCQTRLGIQMPNRIYSIECFLENSEKLIFPSIFRSIYYRQ